MAFSVRAGLTTIVSKDESQWSQNGSFRIGCCFVNFGNFGITCITTILNDINDYLICISYCPSTCCLHSPNPSGRQQHYCFHLASPFSSLKSHQTGGYAQEKSKSACNLSWYTLESWKGVMKNGLMAMASSINKRMNVILES